MYLEFDNKLKQRKKEIAMNNVKSVVLDVDGVILDSLMGTVGAINRTLVEFGGEAIKSSWFKENRLDSLHDFVLSRGVPEDINWDDFYKTLDQFFFRVWLYRERSDIRPVLEFFRKQGLPIYLASACGIDLTKAKLSFHSGLMEFVTEIYGGADRKSEVLNSLLKEQSVLASEVLFITDMPRDIDEAESLRIQKIIALVSEFSSEEQFAGYVWPVVHNNKELLALLKDLF